MTIQYGTTTPVIMCPKPPIERDRWMVRGIQIMPNKGVVAVQLVSALMDGAVPKDRKDYRMNLAWSDVSDFPVGSATTLGKVIADMVESKAKTRGLLPSEATQV